MTQYQITLDSEIQQHIFTGDDGMAKLMEQVLNQVLNAQIRSSEATDVLNGHYNVNEVDVTQQIGSERHAMNLIFHRV
jgi:hypothetical protein